MKLIQRLRSYFGLLVLVSAFLCGAISSGGVFAEGGGDNVPAKRIQISPVRVELELTPGSTKTASFKVQNTGSQAFDYKIKVAPYSVSDVDYAKPDTVSKTKYNDIVDWVTFSKTSGTLDPSSEDTITLTVKVPTDVPAGGQYAVVLAEMDGVGDSDGSSVNVVQQVGMLLYTENINGHTRKEGSVLENKVPSFIFNPPITVTSLVENTGNVHTDVEYVLQVFPLFGSDEIYTNEESPVKQTVLPDTSRYNELSWEGAPRLGIFKVRQTVKAFGKSSVTEKVIFICPIWFLFILVLIVFCVIFWVVNRVRNKNRY